LLNVLGVVSETGSIAWDGIIPGFPTFGGF